MSCAHKTAYAEIGRKMRELPLEGHISSHEWEELVLKMCASDDVRLQAVGNKELSELKQKRSAM